jgi:glycosyltransferase involved in cell wall biosynthesis
MSMQRYRKKILIKGPALSSSGYGEQTRFAINSLRQSPEKYDIYLINTSWGNTSWIMFDHEERDYLDSLVTKTHLYVNNGGTFDASIQVTIPNEFENLTPINIGYTAGIETNAISDEWIVKSNAVNKLLVTSNHAKNGFVTTTAKNLPAHMPKRCETPVGVVHYGVEEQAYTPANLPIQLKSEFNFLTVAQAGPRKNLTATIVNFVKEFHDEDVGLLLKINVSKNTLSDRQKTVQYVNNLLSQFPDRQCHVQILHGTLNKCEMYGLYSHPGIKAYVTTTHGEGFGLPIFEAAACGLPVIAPNWSGHVDFLYEGNKALFTKIDYDLKTVQKTAVWPGVIEEGSYWCFVKDVATRSSMREVYKNYPRAYSKAKKLKEVVRRDFALHSKYANFVKEVDEVVYPASEEPLGEHKQLLMSKISFCIPTNGKKVDKTVKCVKSILAQQQSAPDVAIEIALAGDIAEVKAALKDSEVDINSISFVEMSQEAQTRQVSKLRNAAADKSTGEVICFCDDDILLEEDWLTRTLIYHDTRDTTWDVLGNAILNPDGTRHWDKALMEPRVLVSYRHPDEDPRLMQTSGFFLVKRAVFEKVRWDETKLVYADRQEENPGIPEDVQFNIDFRKKGFDLQFNPMAAVWHNDDSYTEFANQTLKKELIRNSGALKYEPPACERFEKLEGGL